MRAFFLLPAAAMLGLAACAQNPPANPMAATVPTPAAPGAPATSVSANPPDNPAGTQAYQSPDLSRRSCPPGGC